VQLRQVAHFHIKLTTR